VRLELGVNDVDGRSLGYIAIDNEPQPISNGAGRIEPNKMDFVLICQDVVVQQSCHARNYKEYKREVARDR
jgi:hypothetical protein